MRRRQPFRPCLRLRPPVPRPRFSAALLASGLGASLLFAAVLGAQQDQPEAVASRFATGLERHGEGTTTTRDEELALLDAIAAESPRVRVEEIGVSGEGRPIHLVVVGYPEARGAEALESGRNLLFIGAQHGNEPSGREGLLRLLRELAFTSDPDLVAQLGEANLLMIPTANPDGFLAWTRRTACSVDTNRDHLELKTVEARVLAAVQLRFAPEILLDAHEGGNPPERPETTGRFEALWPCHLNTHAEVLQLSREMVEDYVLPALDDLGYRARVWRGRGDRPGVLRNMAGLRHSIGMVTETFQTTAEDRAAMQVHAMRETLRFHRERREEIAAALAAARSGRAPSGPVYLGGTEDEPPEDEEILAPAPAGYLLNAEQLRDLAPQIEGFGLLYEEARPGSYYFPLAQPMGAVLPLVVDPRAGTHLAAATVVERPELAAALDPPPLPPPPTPPGRHLADFSRVDPGTPLRDWTELWEDGSWSVDRALRQEAVAESARRALAWEQPGEIVGDVEVLARVRGNSDSTLFRLALHLSGGPGEENAYYVDLRKPAKQIRINRYAGGRFSTLATADFTVERDRWYLVRFRREGNDLHARIWVDGEEEPDGWNLTANDRALRSGAVGVVAMQPRATSEISFLGVGTGGESAPHASE